MNHDQKTSLLGVVAMALMLACVDGGDGMSVRELLDAVTKGLSP
jgi:hypothetical protein